MYEHEYRIMRQVMCDDFRVCSTLFNPSLLKTR